MRVQLGNFGLQLATALAAARLDRRAKITHGNKRVAGAPDVLVEGAKGVKGVAMALGIEQTAHFMLPENINEVLANFAQECNANWLVVEKSPGGPGFLLNAAQYQRFARFLRDAALRGQRTCGVFGRYGEEGRHRAFGRARAHERGIAPLPESQSESIKENGLARAGFARENAKAGAEFDLGAFDEDDIAHAKPNQHDYRLKEPLPDPVE